MGETLSLIESSPMFPPQTSEVTVIELFDDNKFVASTKDFPMFPPACLVPLYLFSKEKMC